MNVSRLPFNAILGEEVFQSDYVGFLSREHSFTLMLCGQFTTYDTVRDVHWMPCVQNRRIHTWGYSQYSLANTVSLVSQDICLA